MAAIVFVYPDYESLGVSYLMAACRSAGHSVRYSFYRADDSYTGVRKSPDYSGVVADILSESVDIVAFSCVTDNFRYQLKVAETLRRVNPAVFTIFGGVHPTAVPQKVLAHAAVDAVGIGEAEIALPRFLEACQWGKASEFPDIAVPGIVYKKGGMLTGDFGEGPLATPDALPFPDKTPALKEMQGVKIDYRIITSRGCPYSCSYCFNSHFHRMRGEIRLRRRSVANVIEELRQAVSRYSIRYVLFVDDSFTTDKRWLADFCAAYREEIGLPFACNGNPHYVNDQVAEVLARAGCVNFQMGIQSLSEPLCRETLNRKSSNLQIERALQSLKNNRILVQVDHMLGIPGDTLQMQEEAVLFYNRCKPQLISIFWLTYYPGTGIVRTALESGDLRPEDVDLIEQGVRLTPASYLTGGSMRNPGPFYSISFLLNWLSYIPAPIVVFLVKTRLYRIFRIRSYLLSTAVPRAIRSLTDRRDFRGRSHMIRFKNKLGFS